MEGRTPEQEAKVAGLLRGQVPFEIAAFLDFVHDEAGFFLAFPDGSFDDRFVYFDVAAGEIDAGPILLFPVLDQESSVLPVKHDHGGKGCRAE